MGCSGKAIAGVIFGLIGVVAYIAGAGLNEITRSNSALAVAWCGWNGIGACVGLSCEDAKFLYEEDNTSYNDDTFNAQCDVCEAFNQDDCFACKNKMAGQIWIGSVISGIGLGAIGICFLIISATRGFGGGMLVFSAGLGVVGIVAFIALTNVDLGCYSDNYEPAASVYCVIVGIVCFLIGGIVSCGAGKYDT
eukprot:233970_1